VRLDLLCCCFFPRWIYTSNPAEKNPASSAGFFPAGFTHQIQPKKIQRRSLDFFPLDSQIKSSRKKSSSRANPALHRTPADC
jgi:hypothetical protein